MSEVYPRDFWVGARVAVLAIILALGPGCAAQREVTPDPVKLTRPLPITVKKDAWPAIVKTLLLQGEVIQSAPLGRVTFHRPLTNETFPKLCNLKTNSTFNANSWSFFSGIIDITIWLEGEEPEETKLMMEGRCLAEFTAPTWKGMALNFTPLPFLLLGPSWYEEHNRSFTFSSTGELEQELQAKILTQMNVDLPSWLREAQ